LEVALGYQRLVEEADYTQAEVAERVGKNRSTVANMLRLLSLPAFIQAALRDEQISTGHARALISVDDPEDQKAIFKKVIKKGYSVRQTEKAVKALDEKKKAQPTPAKDSQNTFIKEISNRLRGKLKIGRASCRK